MRLTLTIVSFKISAAEAPQRSSITLDDGAITIGRVNSSVNNDWNLPDPNRTLSRQHCRIERQGDDYILTDLSLNGVYVNGAADKLGKDNRVVLRHGDRLGIGDYLVQASIAPAVSQPEPETTAKANYPPGGFAARPDATHLIDAFFKALGIEPPDAEPHQLESLFTQAGLLTRFALTAGVDLDPSTTGEIDDAAYQNAVHAGLRAAAEALRASTNPDVDRQSPQIQFYIEYLRCYKDQQGLQHTLGYPVSASD